MSCVGRRSAVVAKRFALGREVGQGHGVTIWVDGGEHVGGRIGAVADGPVGGVFKAGDHRERGFRRDHKP